MFFEILLLLLKLVFILAYIFGGKRRIKSIFAEKNQNKKV
jgi:hypothetical protein